MPHAPDRPGRHRAAHKAPTRVARLRNTLRTRRSAVLRRHAGTVAALGGVLVAGVAVSGSSLGPTHGSGGADRIGAAGASKQPWKTHADIRSNRAEAGRDQTSRSAVRSQVRELRARDSGGDEPGHGGVSSAEQLMPTEPREIARVLMADYGWDSTQFACLDELWIGESAWDVDATNPTSGAYGIPQSLPPEKMASFGSDWRTNPVTQIEWGLWYIDQSYGTPCSANEFKNAHNWY